MRCVIYSRKSTDDGNDTSDSVQSQIDNLTAFADAKGYDVVGSFFDDGVSGRAYPSTAEGITLCGIDSQVQSYFNGKVAYRDGLANVFTLIKDSDIDLLLIRGETRLMRPLANSHLESFICQFLIQHSTKVQTLDGNVIDYNEYTHKLVSTIQGQTLDKDVKLRKQQSIDARNKKRNEGHIYTRIQTYGITPHRGGRLEYNRDIKAVEYILQSYLDGDSIKGICRNLDKLYPKNKLFKNEGKNRTGGWHRADVRRVLHHPIYAGYQTNTEGVLIKCVDFKLEPIISLQDHIKIVKMKTARSHKRPETKYIFPLRGRVYCGYCGKRLSRNNKRITGQKTGIGNPNAFHELQCETDLRSRSTCDVGIREDYYVGFTKKPQLGLLEIIKPFFIFDLVNRYQASLSDDPVLDQIAVLKQQLDDLTAKTDEIMDLYIESHIIKAQFEKLNQKNNVKIDSIRQEIADLDIKLKAKDEDFDLDKLRFELEAFAKFDQQVYQKIKRHHIRLDNPNENQHLQYLQDNVHNVVKRIDVYKEYIELHLVYNDLVIKLDRYMINNTGRSLPIPVVLPQVVDGEFGQYLITLMYLDDREDEVLYQDDKVKVMDSSIPLENITKMGFRRIVTPVDLDGVDVSKMVDMRKVKK